MTSHYMSCVVKSAFEPLFEALGENFGKLYFKKFEEKDKSRIGIILGEKFYFRARGDFALLIILKETAIDRINIEVISCAGGLGWFGLSLGAQSTYVHRVKDFITKSGLVIESRKEIPYYERPRTKPRKGKPFPKTCVRCNHEIPRTTKYCPYCGIKQS